MSQAVEASVPVTFNKIGFYGDRGIRAHVEHEVTKADVGRTVYLLSEEAAEFMVSSDRATLADSEDQEHDDGGVEGGAPETSDSKEHEQRETKPAKLSKRAAAKKAKAAKKAEAAEQAAADQAEQAAAKAAVEQAAADQAEQAAAKAAAEGDDDVDPME